MARRISFPNVEEYVKKLNRLTDQSLVIIQKSVVEGSKPIADQCKANLNALASKENKYALGAYKKGEKAPLTNEQKEGLIESMGLAPMQNDKGYINTKLGFDGYNKTITKRWPKGQPNAMIARSLESGSSAIEKQPFIRPAIAAKKKEAEKNISDYLDKEIEKIMR